MDTKRNFAGCMRAGALALAAALPALADDNRVRGAGWCGTHLTPEVALEMAALDSTGVYELPSRERSYGFHVVRVKIHIVRPSNGVGGIAGAHAEAALNISNQQFAGADTLLVGLWPIDYIDNDNYYYNIDTQAEVDALRNVNNAPGVLDVYYVLNLATEDGPICGKASFTQDTAAQGVILKNSCVDSAALYSVAAHEIGHYFNLYHTHETAFGAECVNGSNCTAAGDKVCDTPADPGLHLCTNPPGVGACVDLFCGYLGGFLDSCSGAPYSPQTWNTMSYSSPGCMTGFSSGQRTNTQSTLEILRPDHICAGTNANRVFYVGSSVIGDGSWDWPYDAWWQARDAIGTGDGVIAFVESSENEGPIVFDRPVTLINTGTAAVNLGAP